jgi:hypothetical protein
MASYALDKASARVSSRRAGSVTGDVCRQGAAEKGEYVVILDRTFLDPIRWKSTL